MAIQKFEDMQQIPAEQPIVPQKLTPHKPSGTNNEILGERNPLPVPQTDAAIDMELNMLRNIRDTQNDLSSAPEVIKKLSGTKNTVIYLSQSNIKLNTDQFTVTAPSPVNATKYDRIDNMIILTQDPLQDNYTIEDGNFDNPVAASGLTYPGVTPKTGDLFYMNGVNGLGMLYIITSVAPIAMLAFTGFKIEFEKNVDQLSPEQMTNLIRDYFVFKFENVGTDRSVLLQQRISILYDKICKLQKSVTEEYLSRFFDENRNVVRLRYKTPIKDDIRCSEYVVLGRENEFNVDVDRDLNPAFVRDIFDPYVMEFISQSFVDEKLQYKGYSVYPINPVWIGDEFKKVYRNSIYSAFTHRKPDLIKYYYNLAVPFNASTLRDLAYEDWWYFELISGEDRRCVDIFPKGFIGRMKGNTLYDKEYDDRSMLKYNLFIRFANIENYLPNEKDIEPFMKDIDLMDDLELYGIAPLLLYVCYYFKQTVEKRIR
jgi:hypothetical protein